MVENSIEKAQKTVKARHEIFRQMRQKNFWIQTRELMRIEKEIIGWITVDVPGGIVVGYSRTGKSTAITFLQERLKRIYGDKIPIIRLDVIEEDTPTDRKFYAKLLMAIGCEVPKRSETALTLRTRIINLLTVFARESEYNMIILLVDEASELNVKDFKWLMSLYNELMSRDVVLSTFMFGTYKLRGMKELFRSMGETQIVGRFMTKEHIFRGICSELEMQQCMICFDSPITVNLGQDLKISLMDYFFPDAYADGKSFSKDLTHIFWTAFLNTRVNLLIVENQGIPMQYFMSAFKMCLNDYGVNGSKEKYFPELKDIEECVSYSGFLESDCFYARDVNKGII